MSATPVLFAAGPNGVTLGIPEGVTLLPIASLIDTAPAPGETEQRARVATALEARESGLRLSELAATKRRVVILAGDLSRPAPYDIALPAVIESLVKAGIRPSRISVIASPGGCGTLLGRAAIHRYGEEICGEHGVSAWPDDGSPHPEYSAADLRIAVAPRFDGVDFHAFIPPGAKADFSLELILGRGVQIAIEAARAFADVTPAAAQFEKAMPSKLTAADVTILSGGGSPWEETLEEALLSLHSPRVSAKTAVLVFSGEEGLGSSRFARDVWGLIEQAEDVLAAGKSVGVPSAPGTFDPAGVLAESLRRHARTVLFSPAFAEHPEGEDLMERLGAAPHVAARLNVVASQTALWNALALLHGERYSVHAEPLGWRAG